MPTLTPAMLTRTTAHRELVGVQMGTPRRYLAWVRVRVRVRLRLRVRARARVRVRVRVIDLLG